MKLEIFGKNKNLALISILNIACVACMKGCIPEEYAMKDNNPERLGLYWYRYANKIHLYGLANNHWAYILEENDNHILLEFKFRYDHQRKQENALINLIEAFFENETRIIN